MLILDGVGGKAPKNSYTDLNCNVEVGNGGLYEKESFNGMLEVTECICPVNICQKDKKALILHALVIV